MEDLVITARILLIPVVFCQKIIDNMNPILIIPHGFEAFHQLQSQSATMKIYGADKEATLFADVLLLSAARLRFLTAFAMKSLRTV